MNVFPEDLGIGAYQQILSRRARRYGLWQTVQPETHQELDYLASIWIGGSNISKEIARYAGPALNLCLLWQQIIVILTILIFILICSDAGYMWFQSRPFAAEIIAFSGAIVFVVGLLYGNLIVPRQVFSRLHDKLSGREIINLQKDANDELKQTLFGLADAVVKIPQQSNEDLLRNIRKSLYALGNAIDDVQPEEHEHPTADPSSDTITLRKQADKLLLGAAAETDAVIAASIKRRSASLIHQANTIDQITIFRRRNKALRGEISQQMDSLGTRLTASYLMRGNASQGLADVFDQITHLATEASHVAAAQDELVSALNDHL